MPAYGKTIDANQVIHGPARLFLHPRFTSAQLAEKYYEVAGVVDTIALGDDAVALDTFGSARGTEALTGLDRFFPRFVDDIMDTGEPAPEPVRSLDFRTVTVTAGTRTGESADATEGTTLLTYENGIPIDPALTAIVSGVVDKEFFWKDIGATDGGTTISVRRPTSEIRVDHALIGIDSEPADVSVSTTMAEQSWQNLKLALSENNNVVASSVGGDTRLRLAMSGDLQEWMMAIVQRHRAMKKYRAWFFHTVQVDGADVSMPMVPGGGLTNIPVTFRGFAREFFDEVYFGELITDLEQ